MVVLNSDNVCSFLSFGSAAAVSKRSVLGYTINGADVSVTGLCFFVGGTTEAWLTTMFSRNGLEEGSGPRFGFTCTLTKGTPIAVTVNRAIDWNTVFSLRIIDFAGAKIVRRGYNDGISGSSLSVAVTDGPGIPCPVAINRAVVIEIRGRTWSSSDKVIRQARTTSLGYNIFIAEGNRLFLCGTVTNPGVNACVQGFLLTAVLRVAVSSNGEFVCTSSTILRRFVNRTSSGLSSTTTEGRTLAVVSPGVQDAIYRARGDKTFLFFGVLIVTVNAIVLHWDLNCTGCGLCAPVTSG